MNTRRVELLLEKYKKEDKSFQEKETQLQRLFRPFGESYTKYEMRNTWFSGIKHGIEIGLFESSLEGQKIQLYDNITDPKQKEFLDKFYALASEYNCSIQYHPIDGMTVIFTGYNNL